MLYLCAVSGLVVSRMEAILEHGCLDIVAFFHFLERDGFNFLANLVLVHLLFADGIYLLESEIVQILSI